jgi:protocatechuate 3,4-dioxygenase beta subunit
MLRMARPSGPSGNARRSLACSPIVVLLAALLAPLAAVGAAAPAIAQSPPSATSTLPGSGQAVISASASPSEATAGSTVVLTANVSPTLLALLGSIPVTFSVVAGPNQGTTLGCTVTYVVEAVGVPIGGSNSCSVNYTEPSNRSGQDTISAAGPDQSPGAQTTVTWLGVAGAIQITPEASFNTVGNPDTVTATVLDVNGAAVSGASVTFTASGTGGENPPTATVSTDASGDAAFTFTSTNAGTSTIVASAGTPSGSTLTASATATWASNPAQVTLTQDNLNGLAQVGASDTVSAAVVDAHGLPVGDNTAVTFMVTGAGAQVGEAPTSAGNAVFSFSSNVTGTSTIVATAGTITSSPVTATWQTPVASSISLTPRLSSVVVGNTQTLVAQVLDQFGNPVAGALVRFAVVGANPSATTSSGNTDSTGRLAFQETGANPGRDTVVAYVDLHNDATIDPGDPYTTADIFWQKKPGQGYWLVASDGGIFNYGPSANFYGSTGSIALNKPIVGMAATPDGGGYWLVASDGGIFAFGDAQFYGSTGSIRLNKPIVGMAATPDGGGYWLVASDGGIFAFGDAQFYGSTGSIRLNKPIVGMAATPDGGGYWLVASDGGIFAFGDAGFHGSTGSIALNKPIVGMAATPDGGGYWLVATDGGIFAFGDAPFDGSTGNITLNKPIIGIGAIPDGSGYYLAGTDGGVFNFGPGAQMFGSAAGAPLNKPVVGIAVAP